MFSIPRTLMGTQPDAQTDAQAAGQGSYGREGIMRGDTPESAQAASQTATEAHAATDISGPDTEPQDQPNSFADTPADTGTEKRKRRKKSEMPKTKSGRANLHKREANERNRMSRQRLVEQLRVFGMELSGSTILTPSERETLKARGRERREAMAHLREWARVYDFKTEDFKHALIGYLKAHGKAVSEDTDLSEKITPWILEIARKTQMRSFILRNASDIADKRRNTAKLKAKGYSDQEIARMYKQPGSGFAPT